MMKGTEYTPQITFNISNNEFKLVGNSYNEHANEFYKPIFDWLNDYTATNRKPIHFYFQLSYYNSSSHKMFIEIIEILDRHHTKYQVPIHIHWHTQQDDKEMLDDGQNLQGDFPRLNFQFYQS